MKPHPLFPSSPHGRPPAGERQTKRRSKVARWIQRLSDPQVVELMRRLFAVARTSPDIDPKALKQVLLHFADELP